MVGLVVISDVDDISGSGSIYSEAAWSFCVGVSDGTSKGSEEGGEVGVMVTAGVEVLSPLTTVPSSMTIGASGVASSMDRVVTAVGSCSSTTQPVRVNARRDIITEKRIDRFFIHFP